MTERFPLKSSPPPRWFRHIVARGTELPEWLGIYRVYCILSGSLLLVFWLSFEISNREFFDPLWMRAAISAFCFGAWLTSYHFESVARRLNHIVHALLYVISIWFVVLTAKNQFAADFSIGLIFVVSAISLALSYVPDARRTLLLYQLTMASLVSAAVAISPHSMTGRVVLISCVASIGIVTAVAARIRASIEKERELFQERLVQATTHAEEMLRLKSSFINNMNHEIRTPLTGIIGFAEIIAESADDQMREYAGVIQNAGRRLMDTLSSILDLAHLEAGSFDLQLHWIDLKSASAQAAALLNESASRKGVWLKLEQCEDPVVALADYAAVSRVIYNLASNGIKFTDSGGITIRSYLDGSFACVSVSDTGIGIEKEFIPHIFDEFKQASSGIDRSHEGSGLGLTIAKRLIELMDGEICIESDLGSGSTFTVKLPQALYGDGATRDVRLERVGW